MINSHQYFKEIIEELKFKNNNICEYCKTNLSDNDIGYALNIKTDNPSLICSTCKMFYSSHDSYDLYDAAVDSFNDNFKMNDDGLMIGLTKKGNRTIDKLSLNREVLVDSRKMILLLDDLYDTLKNNKLDVYKNFKKNIKEIKDLNKIVTDKDSNRTLLSNMLYANIVTALETYLSDTFLKLVISNQKFLVSFVNTYHDFKSEKFPLKDIFLYYDDISNIATKRIQDVIFHDLAKISGMYKETFGVEFPKVSEIYKIVLIRHDIVHRNGKNKKDFHHNILTKDVDQVCNLIYSFVSNIQENIDEVLIEK